MTVRRKQWADLPEQAQRAIQDRVGTVTAAQSAGIGLTSGVATRILTAQGAAFFVKAAPAQAPIAPHYVREQAVNQTLPAGIPAPRLIWADDVSAWHVLLFDHVPGRAADLVPNSPDIPHVLNVVTSIGVPCPWRQAPSGTHRIAGLLRVAQPLIEAPSVELADYAALAKQLDADEFAGPYLVHADLHADNLLVHDGAVRVVDWSFACRGAPWVDTALLIPRLIDAGHTPAAAEQAAALVPAWLSAPPDAITALAAARVLFALHMAEHGPHHFARKRRRTAEACRTWVDYRRSKPGATSYRARRDIP
jgi:hypothetical protein